MRISDIIWKSQFAEKLAEKHAVSTEEAEQIIFGPSHFLRVEKGRAKGEDVYEAFGKTWGGRYMVVFFIKKGEAALPISARDMTESERRYYGKEKK